MLCVCVSVCVMTWYFLLFLWGQKNMRNSLLRRLVRSVR